MRDQTKIKGCLLGGAAGDALGYAIEFDSERGIFDRYGSGGIREYELQNGKAVFSDDTQMTLFTAEGILLAADPMDHDSYLHGMFDAMQEWLETQRYHKKIPAGERKVWLTDIPALNKRRAPGNTCLSALESRIFGSVEKPVNNSKGCGGVMRVAPIGLYYSPDGPGWQEIDRRGAAAAALTHGHPLGYIPAAGLVHIVNLAMYRPEMSLKEIVEDAIEKVSGMFEEPQPADAAAYRQLMEEAVRLAESEETDLNAIHRLGEGWVAEEALAIAVYCALKYSNDFDAAVIAAVNHKGDSDSTGAIAGNILGTYLGLEGITEKYLADLELRDVIEQVAERLAK